MELPSSSPHRATSAWEAVAGFGIDGAELRWQPTARHPTRIAPVKIGSFVIVLRVLPDLPKTS
jgi:hypothetical protein